MEALSFCFAYSNRCHGNMSLAYGDTASSPQNRNNFLKTLNIDYRKLVCAKQVHASQIRYASEEDTGKGAFSYENALAGTDALVTDRRGLPLAIFTADCLSIFLYDRLAKAIGLIHAGWRSTAQDIAVKTVRYMSAKFNTDSKNLTAYFGPCIGSCCYEVDQKLKDFFPDSLLLVRDKYYLDLSGVNKKQLLSAGLKEEDIHDCGVCTSCGNSDFFSFRKEGPACGRMISVMMLK